MSKALQPILGFDYGLSRIGIAVGQKITKTATPVTILKVNHGKVNWQAIETLIKHWRPSDLVVGVPLMENPSDTGKAMIDAADQFARDLAKFSRPVHTINEYLSSKEVKQQLLERQKKQPKHIDDLAAVLILESWLAQ